MRYRVIKYKENAICQFPHFFRTKHEAVAYQQEHGGTLERKVGYNWYAY